MLPQSLAGHLSAGVGEAACAGLLWHLREERLDWPERRSGGGDSSGRLTPVAFWEMTMAATALSCKEEKKQSDRASKSSILAKIEVICDFIPAESESA